MRFFDRYIHGGVGPEMHQQQGAGRRLLDSLLATRVANGPGRTTTADLPPLQKFPSRPRLIDGDAVVPGSTGGELLPGRLRLGVSDGEPGAANANDFDLED